MDSPKDNKEEACSCTAEVGSDDPGFVSCDQKYVTEEEVFVVNKMHQLKAQVRQLKSTIAELQRGFEPQLFTAAESDLSDSQLVQKQEQQPVYDRWSQCQASLDELRQQWKQWADKRYRANQRKLMLLGHIPWRDL